MTTPDWLADHDGRLRAGPNAATWLVLLDNQPVYRLTVAPAKNQFSCAVMQSNSGNRLDAGSAHDSADAAVQGGLNELRQALGW